MCLIGGTAYHLEQTRHWWDCFPPGPTCDLVNLLMICSMGTFPRRSFRRGGSVSCFKTAPGVTAPTAGAPGFTIGLEDTAGKGTALGFAD